MKLSRIIIAAGTLVLLIIACRAVLRSETFGAQVNRCGLSCGEICGPDQSPTPERGKMYCPSCRTEERNEGDEQPTDGGNEADSGGARGGPVICPMRACKVLTVPAGCHLIYPVVNGCPACPQIECPTEPAFVR